MTFLVACDQIKKSKEDILRELQQSLENNNVVGILLKDTRELVTTAVRGIEDSAEGDVTIILNDCDLHGYTIERTTVKLSNIEKLIHFSIDYDDPVYVLVRRKEKFKA
jgi:hypothetical protein